MHEPTPPASLELSSLVPRGPAGLRLLLAWPDPSAAGMLARLTADPEAARTDITWVTSGAAALTAMQGAVFDVLLVGLALDGQAGLDLVRMTALAGRPVPTIVLLEPEERPLAGDVLAAGADDYLVRGHFDADAFGRAVRGAIERARLRTSLRAAEGRFRAVMRHASDFVAIVDARHRVTFVSPSVERLFGHAPGELDRRAFADLAHPDDADYLRAFLTDVGSAPNRMLALEWRMRHANGSWRHVESVVANLADDHAVGGIVVTTHDTHDRKTLQAQLAHQAFHDPVTSIANRALFVSRADHALARARRQDRALAVLCLDLDDFKAVNDRLGHGAGDGLLTAVAARLQGCMRADDIVARLGGDEFAVLIEGTDVPAKADLVADRILQVLGEPFDLARGEVRVGASVGIAVSEHGRETSEELLRNADLAMYMAKEQGKGRHARFEPSMHATVLARLELEGDLRRAVERQEFTLHFQPIVRMDGAALAGFEALVRWRRPGRGLVPPLDFIASAEQTGLIVPLGRWVLRSACEWVARLQALHGADLMMSVNVSGRQLQDRSFPDDVRAAVQGAGIAPASLVLEITETVMMEDTRATLARLEALKALGVRIAIDDFGTGYSSLNYLQQFPVDILKIDRAFVERLRQSDDGAVARAIVGLSRALKLSTIAEGIERPDQVAALLALECEYGQGYYFARPVPEERVEAVVRAARLGTVWADEGGSHAIARAS